MTEITSRRPDALAATNRSEKPFVWPYLAFTGPRSQLRKRGQRPISAQAVPSTASKGASVTSEAKLAWALADAVSACFTAKDQLGIYTTLGAGETYSAIERMLDIAVRKRYPLPARLISALAAWLDCYIGNEHEPTTRSLLNHVEPEALPAIGGLVHRATTRRVAPEGGREQPASSRQNATALSSSDLEQLQNHQNHKKSGWQ